MRTGFYSLPFKSLKVCSVKFFFFFSTVYCWIVQFSSVTQSCLTICDTMNCSTPGLPAHPNSCPLSRWYHPTVSSSVVPFSACPQSFPASGSFPTAPSSPLNLFYIVANTQAGKNFIMNSTSVLWHLLWPLALKQLLFFFNFYFYFILLYNTVLVLPYIDMNPPRVYMRSQTWTPLPLSSFKINYRAAWSFHGLSRETIILECSHITEAWPFHRPHLMPWMWNDHIHSFRLEYKMSSSLICGLRTAQITSSWLFFSQSHNISSCIHEAWYSSTHGLLGWFSW